MKKKFAVIICAAGPGSRFGGKTKKQYVNVGGRAVFVRSVEMFSNRSEVKQILLGISEEDEEIVHVKWGPNLKFFGVKVFFGGDSRIETVQKGLELIKDDIDLVAVHDACRCCVTEQMIDEVFKVAAQTEAAILACPVTATIKKAKDKIIEKTIDRSNLYEAQTPQVFSVDLLRKAYAQIEEVKNEQTSDDSILVETLGHPVTIVETDSSNIKITRNSDIAIAEAIIKSKPKPQPKGPLGPYVEAQW